MTRRQVGIRELKNDLSRWVARARGGQEIVVTERGTPVARLGPVADEDPLEALIAAGLVERARRRAPALRPQPRIRLRGAGPSMAAYVARERR
jgi:prevent-host-death family protein